MKAKLKELRGQIEERREKLHEVFEQAGPDNDMSKVTCIDGDSTAKVEKIRELNDEIDDLCKQVEPLEAVEAEITKARREADRLGELKEHPGHPVPQPKETPVKEVKSIGELFTDYKVGHELKGQEVEIPEVGLKTLMETGAGWAPETTRTSRMVEYAVAPIQVTDIVPSTTTAQAAVVYMEETTFTNNAAETAEAAQFPEAALALTERSSTVRKIAVFIPVTDEQLEDVPQAQGYINNRLPFMVRQRLDTQILTGDGSAPNLRGFLNTSNIQTQAKGADPTPDAIYKAMTKVRVTGRAVPGAVILHPNDWQEIRLLRTSDGIYIWGNPSEAGPERIWGLPVVQSDGETEGTGLVGDFANFTELSVRKGIEMKVSDSHSDYFIKGKQAIRATMRAALIVYRPTALCTVTGI